jgi:hypothetical protein
MMKRVLIITYYWPPAGGPGVQRWLNFVKYFKEFGIEPIVYIPENPHYPLIDKSFISEVPVDIEILKHPVKEPYKIAGILSKKKTKQISSGIITKKKQSFIEKLLLFVRGNFFIPDARIGWVKPSVKFLKEYISNNKIDTVITSGPPHSLHLIGMQLKADCNLSWIADFRDPWTTIHYHKSLRLTPSSIRKHKELEAKVLNNADKIVVTSPTTKSEFEMITETPISVITNGYEISTPIKSILDLKFSIAHVGSLLSERNPKVMWKVLSELSSEEKEFKNDLNLKFAGALSNDVLASIETYGLKDNCTLLGYISHKEALQIQHNAQILLLLEINSSNTKAIIPGKLFEYLAARRPIIALGPQGSDIKAIIEETNSGVFFNHYEEDELKKTILDMYNQYKKESLKIDSLNIEKYSRRELTNKMAFLIKN